MPLSTMGTVALRWQVLTEARLENPTPPDYDAANYILGSYLESAGSGPLLEDGLDRQAGCGGGEAAEGSRTGLKADAQEGRD